MEENILEMAKTRTDHPIKQCYSNLFCFAEEVSYFENFDLESIVTPVDTVHFKQLLEDSRYPPDKIDYLIDGFENGFSIGYQGPANVQHRSKNLKFREVGNKTELWNKVMKEVKLKCYAGPFEDIPFDNFIQSSIGLVPKDNGKKYQINISLVVPQRAQQLVHQRQYSERSVHSDIPRV